MLNWLLRKKRPNADRSATQAPPEPAAMPAKPVPEAPDRSAWQQRVDAARGDDAALVELAQLAPLLDLKLAAVEALQTEGALRQAERAFRSHDRKVHQRVRQRLAGVVAQREARATADAAIATAQGLLGVTPIAANRLAALDRDWGALGAELLDPTQSDAFATLRVRLDNALQAQDEAQRAAQWSALAAPLLAELQRACEASATGNAAHLERCIAAAQTRFEACPAAARASELAQALGAELDAARLALEAMAQAAAEEAAEAARRATLAAPPETHPPTDAVPTAAAAPAAGVAVTPPPLRVDWLPEVEAALQQGEAAVADGSTGGLDRQLQAIDTALLAQPGRSLPTRLRSRLHALQAERQRLRGWQQWGGAVARESLVDESEALAHLTAAAQADPSTGKLDLRRHGEAIRKLRARWKELDRTGAAPGQALWLRFDAALTLAHAPVAAQQAALQAARAENLAAREVLLASLDATGDPAATPREALQALQAFQAAWRKLGPVAHTVPAAAAAALQQRVEAATARIEAPLAAARGAAQREREALVERAEALAAEHEREAPLRLRELQAEWQQHARMLPLPRAAEAALWARFRQACDAVAARREAAQQARDAEAATGIAAREALLQRLAALAQDASLAPTGLARMLAEIDREWRDLYTPLPRALAEGLEARFHDLRAAAEQAASARRRQHWEAQCDAVAARLALCEQREAAGAGAAADANASADTDTEDLAQSWQSAPPAPVAWQRAFDMRWSGSAPAAGGAADAAETLLLRLEDALGITPAADQAQARRELKLRALKDALEGRAQAARAASQPPHPASGLAALLARPDLTAPQRQRLRALIAAMRAAPAQFDN